MKLKNLFYAVLILALGACSDGDSYVNGDVVKYCPVMLEGSNSWSFIDSNGQIYMEDDFTNEPTCVIDGIFTVSENDGYVVYRFDKKPQPIKGLEDLKCVGCPHEGLLGVVKPKERIKFVDIRGETIFELEPIGGKEIVLSLSAFTDGLLMVQDEDGKTGFVDKKGIVAIKPMYDAALPFNEGYSIAVKRKDDKEVKTVIDKKGKEVAKIKSNISIYSEFDDDDGLPHFEYGVIPAYIDNDGNRRVGFLNTKGEFTKLNEKVSHIVEYNSKVVIFIDSGGLYGIISRDGEMIQRPKYELLRFLGDDQYIACKDNKYMILDSKGEKIPSKVDDYESLLLLNGRGFCLLGLDGSTWSLVDKEGKKIGKDEYKKFGSNLSMNDELFSDYFNMGSFVDAITSLINTDGIGKYKIGTPVKNYLTDASNYTYTASFRPEKQPKDGYRYSVSYTVNASETIAISEYDYFSNNVTTYSFNPNSKIDGGTISASAEVPAWTDAKPMIVNALKAKGFKVDESSDDYVLMSDGKSNLSIMRYDGDDICIEMSKKMVYTAVSKAAPVAESSGSKKMEGKIDNKFAIVMTLNINPNSNSVEGNYYYTKYGPSNVIYLRGTCQDLDYFDNPTYKYKINVTEYDKNGKSYGRFEGDCFVEYGNFGIDGQYIDATGKSMPFSVVE